MSTCVVVGGGIVGLACALIARETHTRTVLIEKGANCGGLLSSIEINGAYYDYGTHIPGPVGVEDLDTLLYGSTAERERDYHYFPYLQSENYHSGRWFPSSPLIDTRNLPPELYHRGVLETLVAAGAPAGERNLLKYLRATFGDTFTETIYRPVYRKLLGAELEQLDSDVLRLFGLQRLIALTPQASREIKKVGRYDSAFAFHSYTEGAPSVPYLYPRGNRGIGWWPDQLEARLRGVGGEILTRENVTRIAHDGGRASAVDLESGKRIDCDQIIWTIPPVFACRAAGIEVSGPRPSFRMHTLVHLRYAQSLLMTKPQYLLCWEPSLLTYRVTLYPNITPDRRAAATNNLTVEVLGDETSMQRTEETAAKVERELVDMEVVAPDNAVVERRTVMLGPTFPVMTSTFLDTVERQAAEVRSRIQNLLLFGRGGSAFLISDVLQQAWRTLKGQH